MSTSENIILPPLPSPFGIVNPDGTEGYLQYTTTDLQDYAKAYAITAIEADRQARSEPVAWLCTPDFEGEQFLATTQGAADTLEKDGWSVQPLYEAPQPQQQTSKHVKDRRIDDVVRGLKASVAVGSDGQWVSVRREARDAAINRLQELNSDCAHMYESYVEAAAGPAPQPQQIPEYAEIYVGNGKFAICDWGDFDLVKGFKWYLTSKNKSGCLYAQSWDSGNPKTRNKQSMHRMIMAVGENQIIDHINGNGLDNRRSNLRVVNAQQNAFNQKGHGGSSRFKGVSFDKESGKWRAYIRHNNRRVNLGRHFSEIDAAKAYDVAAKEYFGEHAKLNLG